MLAFVVGGAPAIPAVATGLQVPGRTVLAPLALVAAYLIAMAMAMAQHGECCSLLDAARHHEWRRIRHQIGQYLAVKAQGCQLQLQVIEQDTGAAGHLSPSRASNALLQDVEKIARVEMGCGLRNRIASGHGELKQK